MTSKREFKHVKVVPVMYRCHIQILCSEKYMNVGVIYLTYSTNRIKTGRHVCAETTTGRYGLISKCLLLYYRGGYSHLRSLIEVLKHI